MEYQEQPVKTFSSFLKKFNLMMFFTLQIVMIEACQFRVAEHDILLSDEIRNIHADQLLVDKAVTPNYEFNGDKNFNLYIADFLKQKNTQIDSNRFVSSLISISRQHAYDPIFLLAVIQTESEFDQNAIGSVGEVGLMQIRPETAEWICRKNNILWRGAGALKDPSYNILVGSHYFHYLKNSFNSETYKYITAYNTGVRGMQRQDGEKHPYFNKVIANYISIYAQLKKIKTKYNIKLYG